MSGPDGRAHGGDDLSGIAREGEFLEAGIPGGPELGPDGPTSSQQPGDADAEQRAMWAMLPKTFGNILSMAMPELREVYSDAACDAWGAAMLPVAKKHGWNTDTLSAEVTLLMASVPFALATVAAIARRRAAARGGATARAAPGAPPSHAAGPGAGTPIDAAPPNINE